MQHGRTLRSKFKLILCYVFLLLSTFIISCDQNTIVFPKLCTEEPDYPFPKVLITIETDTVSQRKITLDRKGYVFGDSILIKRNGIIKNARISGYICKDMIFHLSVTYNDTVDNSQLKIEGNVEGNIVRADVLYCPNNNVNCTFVKIGYFFGSYAGTAGAGDFTTPLFNGLIYYTGSR